MIDKEQKNIQTAAWSENVILADADYVDRVAFDLTVNFERMIGRRIPPADMAKWLDCVALDGGLRPQADGSSEGVPQVQVVLIHSKKRTAFQNFLPASFEGDLNGRAFRDSIGEFVVSAYPVEDMVGGTEFFLDALNLVCQQKAVRRLMVVADDHIYNNVRATLNRAGGGSDRQTTVFTMEPMPGGTFMQEILGYSLMAALGIRADEILEQ